MIDQSLRRTKAYVISNGFLMKIPPKQNENIRGETGLIPLFQKNRVRVGATKRRFVLYRYEVRGGFHNDFRIFD